MDAPITLAASEERLLNRILASKDIEREKRMARFIWFVIAPVGCAAVLVWGALFGLLRECVIPAIGLAGLISAIGYARLMHYRLYRIIKSLSDKSESPAGR
jgi:hypothetical protein